MSKHDRLKREKQKTTSSFHPFFTKDIDYGYKAPNYHALRVNLLTDAKKSVSLLIDSYRSQRIECGCTIMSDGWRDIRHRHLINFLFYCAKGISFLKFVDASDIVNNASNLCNLFAEIVELVGEKNVVQIVTANATNYKLVEIIRPGATRFGTAFIALKSLYDHKVDLQAMVISNDFKKMLEVVNALECKQIVLNDFFWKNCLITVKVMTPLLRILGLCDTDEKPALGYVYEGIHRARKGVKE
ncbi:hypothetical protein LXL04_023025 [Taraxacum kok-saghyz]